VVSFWDGNNVMALIVESLDRVSILSQLSAVARSELKQLQLFTSLDSTNNCLLSAARDGQVSGTVCLAEQQTAGRGRQGRHWVTPFGASLALSLLWRFMLPPDALSGLSLVTGIALARALRTLGVLEVGLKWPNDLWWRERKLGGILLESGGSAEQFYVVAGIGLNVALPPTEGALIDQPWVDLQEILGSATVARNHLAAVLINELIAAFTQFQHEGFIGFAEEWKSVDRIDGKRVQLRLPNATVVGIARGVDRTGALLLETLDGRITPYLGGEISLRLAL
jgi:BirA family biotin operon repressor/biotin-[acetyl-CoA-carboxylase] ligase